MQRGDSIQTKLTKILFFALGMFCLSLVFSAVIRYTTSIPIELSLYLGAFISLVVILPNLKKADFTQIATAQFLASYTLFLVGIVACLYNPSFDGFPGTGDSANHLEILYKFVGSNPKIYFGFTVFHNTVFWIGKLLALNSFEAFRATFYFSVALSLLFILIILRHSLSQSIGWIIILVFCAMLSLFTLLPIYAFNQMHGFYGHLFSIPLFLLLPVLYSQQGITPLHRWFNLSLCVIAIRFTYGLNLAEVFLTLTILVMYDRDLFKTRIWLRYAIGLGGVLIAGYCFYRIFDRMYIDGFYQKIGPEYLWLLELLVVLGILYLKCSKWGNTTNLWKKRFYHFCFVFLLIHLPVQALYYFIPERDQYYFYKHFVLSSLIASLCFIVLLFDFLSIFRSSTKRVKYILPFIVWIFLFAQWKGYEFHRYFVSDRIKRIPPWKGTTSLADSKGMDLIHQIIQEKGKEFGFVLVPAVSGASAFMNTNFTRENHKNIVSRKKGRGRCFF